LENPYQPIRANILIVDDRPDNILVLRAVLEGSPDYMITTESSGPEVIERVKQTHFALILLDIQMHEMDGYETAVEIKKLERGKHVPIVMVTAIFREDREKSRQDDCDADRARVVPEHRQQARDQYEQQYRDSAEELIG